MQVSYFSSKNKQLNSLFLTTTLKNEKINKGFKSAYVQIKKEGTFVVSRMPSNHLWFTEYQCHIFSSVLGRPLRTRRKICYQTTKYCQIYMHKLREIQWKLVSFWFTSDRVHFYSGITLWYLFNKIYGGLKVQTEIYEDPFNSLSLVFFLLENKHMVIEKLLQFLVREIDT